MTRLRPKYRSGRCYELAWRYLIFDERFADGGWLLVHGEIVSPIGSGLPIQHAWLSGPKGVFDPVSNRYFDSAEYETRYSARENTTYAREEARKVGLDAGHYGPWPGTRTA